MQSEDFDNKVRNAAAHHHPAYDEGAWDKMEQLLDKHLPQKNKDKKRRFLFILVLLLAGSGAGLFMTTPWKKNKTIADVKIKSTVGPQHQQNNVPQNNATAIKESNHIIEEEYQIKKENIPGRTKINSNKNSSVSVKTKVEAALPEMVFEKISPLTPVINKTGNDFSFDKRAVVKEKINNEIIYQSALQRNFDNTGDLHKSLVDDAITSNIKTNPKSVSPKNTLVQNGINENKDTSTTNFSNNKITGDTTTNDLATTDAGKHTKNKTIAKKIIAKKNNEFFFSFSTGPDVSFAGSGKAGPTKLLTGAGLGFIFKNKWTLRSGYYSATKLYDAAAGAYHPPANFYTYYPYLQKVDANCKVVEIPFLVSYSFGKSSAHNWFASTGLSTYLMKKEVYNYEYKTTAMGPTMKGSWTVANQNKHLFSVVNISGGYQHHFNKNILVIVEPYFKMPLSGIGYGKVKLNSAGVLFTFAIKPFK